MQTEIRSCRRQFLIRVYIARHKIYSNFYKRKKRVYKIIIPDSNGLPFHYDSRVNLTLKAANMTVADDIHKYLFGPGFDTRSGNILSFLLPLFQEGQLSVTGESMCTKYWLTASEV